MGKQPKKAPKKQTIPVWVLGLLAVLVLAVGIALVLNGSQKNSASETAALPKEISVDTAAQKRDQGVLMLDVREQTEWDEFHMPGAKLIPLGQLETRLSELPKDQQIVVVCRSGNRSATGRDLLLNAGFTQVTSMAGGMNEWRSKGLPVATGP
jgi:rhodanese-related sulfurtransferase